MKRPGIAALVLKIVIALLLVYLFVSCLAADTRIIDIPKVSQGPKIDGIISEQEWQGSARFKDFFETSPGENIPADVKTIVLLAHDDDNLYIGFECFDPDVSQIRTSSRERDHFVMSEDLVIVTLDPFRTRKGGYFLSLNPSGVQMDYYYKWETGETDIGVDMVWYCAARILDDKWSAEIALPFASLQLPSGTIQQWLLDISRCRPRDNFYTYSWRPIPRGEQEFANMPVVRFSEIANRLKLIGIPFAVGNVEKDLDKWDNTGRLGVTGRIQFRKDSFLGFAIYPDYSQIESDALEIDINTNLAIYYPEKRPFFMERKEFFETPIYAVFTRSINDPVVAIKATTNIGRTAIGYIGALDRHTPLTIPLSNQSICSPTDRESYSNIVRLRSELPRESRLGLLLTDREMDSGYNRVVGIDGATKLLANYYLSVQWLKSWTKEPDDSTLLSEYSGLRFGDHTVALDGEKFSGEAFFLNFKRVAKHLNLDLSYLGLSPTMRVDNGFLQTNDLRQLNLTAKYVGYPSSPILESFSVGETVSYERTYSGEHKLNQLDSFLNLTLGKQNVVQLHYVDGSRTYLGYRLDNMWNVSLMWLNSTLQQFSISTMLRYGKDIDYFAYPPVLGNVLSGAAIVELRPTRNTELTVSMSRYILWADDIQSPTYDMTVVNTKGSLSLSKHLNLRTIVQYSRSIAQYMEYPEKKIIVAPLISFELTPFSLFYVGSNLTYVRSGDSYRSTNPKYFAKLQYELGT